MLRFSGQYLLSVEFCITKHTKHQLEWGMLRTESVYFSINVVLSKAKVLAGVHFGILPVLLVDFTLGYLKRELL